MMKDKLNHEIDEMSNAMDDATSTRSSDTASETIEAMDDALTEVCVIVGLTVWLLCDLPFDRTTDSHNIIYMRWCFRLCHQVMH